MDLKVLSAKRILSVRNDVCQPMDHICSKQFCDPMSEFDMIHHRILKAPAIHESIFVCKYRQIHECGLHVCKENPKNGVCQKTGIYVGHPESGFLRNPTSKYRKTTASDRKRDSSMFAKNELSIVVSNRKKKNSVFNFASAMLGQDAMEKHKEDETSGFSKREESLRIAKIEEKKRKRQKKLTIEEELDAMERVREIQLFGKNEDELLLEDEKEEEGIIWGKSYKEKRDRKLKNASSNPQKKNFIPFKRKRKDDLDELKFNAKTIINSLFYSGTREKINVKKRNEAADRSKRKIKAYKQKKKNLNQPWIVIEILTIDANERLITDHIADLVIEDDLIDYFASVVMRAWEIVNTSPWGEMNQGRIRFEQHCLGVLYHMRRGFQPDGVIYIPKHDYMKYLPHVNDLKDFGFEKKNVKSGMKVVQNAYKSAKKERWTVSRLRMHNGSMSIDHGKIL